MPKVFKLILLIVLFNLVGGVGAVFTFNSIPNWYAFLEKPFFSPPNYVFGPVWTLLYTLMAVSFYGILETKATAKLSAPAIKNFWIQLFLNGIWTPIFFGAKNLGLALIVIVAMWVYIVRTIKSFAPINLWSSIFLYPYLIWVSFATILNFSIWFLNM